jgi:hypothetical protein
VAALQVNLTSQSNAYGAPVTVEVIDGGFERVAQESVDIGSGTHLSLQAGMYLVRVTLPSGEQIDRKVVVTESDVTTADFEIDSPHEWMGFARISSQSVMPWPMHGSTGSAGSPQWEEAGPEESEEEFEADDLPAFGIAEKEMPGAGEQWARVLQRDNGAWVAAPALWHDANPILSAAVIEVASPQRGCFVQVGGEHLPSTFIALPAQNLLTVTLRLRQGETIALADRIETIISGQDRRAETLLGYLASGAIKQARQVAEASLAESLLYGKFQDPTAAAVGGYYLLRIGDIGRLHNWASNLADWFDWLPDGPIIHAWQMLYEPEPDMQAARARLLQAVDRGVPFYTDGLRLLFDGLTMLAANQDEPDPLLDEALGRVRRYAMAAVWSATTTTFLGTSPDEPTLDAPIGLAAPFDADVRF